MLPVFQFAYFVTDLEDAARHWARTLGAGPSFDPGALNYTPTALTSFPAASLKYR